MTNQLTSEQFKKTMIGKMINVTDTAEATVEIWPYVIELNKHNIVLDYVLNNRLVELVYRNYSNSVDHVLLPTENPDTFVVIVVNLKEKNIEGHYKLDLEGEYGSK